MKKAGCTAVNLNTLRYFFREAFTSLIRNSWLSLSSVGIVTVSLIILGVSLLLAVNAEKLTQSVESSVEITAFLEENVGRVDRDRIAEAIKSSPEVARLEFVSKEQALKEMKESFGERADILESLEETNPLPDAFRIKTHQAAAVPAVARQIEQIKGVEQVRYGQGVVEKLLNVTRWIRYVSAVAVTLLTLAAGFLIATTIRMSVFARRREIGIMKILGATNWFVRFPFILEGIVLGLAGGLLAVLAVDLAYLSLINKLKISLPFIQLVSEPRVILTILGGMAGLGVMIGALGSWFSLRKFLRV
ncbi:Cell division protein FtsX [Desulforamulus hydrothermalis Lam5 = DSM 18033]|uniref:Cell division protein FtsX n=1 Tax=Desulforamulus hydrothermalis Lam5 = DSM 18033 TaxID=1121428 RepID=K8E7U9_9FIRM|nr:Cell division protein FtsX [Desulforamulus hydrothermalis Lam5 = DSM 18033]SHH20471.1 cell division protein FtsX [Desulforamulus hydrothermalis Lam5 = DSM 18033]